MELFDTYPLFELFGGTATVEAWENLILSWILAGDFRPQWINFPSKSLKVLIPTWGVNQRNEGKSLGEHQFVQSLWEFKKICLFALLSLILSSLFIVPLLPAFLLIFAFSPFYHPLWTPPFLLSSSSSSSRWLMFNEHLFCTRNYSKCIHIFYQSKSRDNPVRQAQLLSPGWKWGSKSFCKLLKTTVISIRAAI